MELHLCSSIDELNKMSEIDASRLRNFSPKQLISSAEKLINKARYHFDDTKLSYVFYMKYLNVVSVLQKLPAYNQNKKTYDSQLGKNNVKEAISKAESLNKELKEFYELQEKKLLREKLELAEKFSKEQKSLTAKPEEESVLSTSTAGYSSASNIIEDETFISCWSLDTMIKQKSKSFMIFDVRSVVDFEKSHIKHSNCCSISEEILKSGGLSAVELSRQLDVTTRVEWNKRLDADVNVLVDWFGNDIPGTAIHTLREIMTKWDPKSTYKGTIKVLKGGYDDWLIRFPLQTTNPHVTFVTKTSDILSIPSVDEIEYPDLDSFDPHFLARESTYANSGNEQILYPSLETKPGLPTVNRSTKPALEPRQSDRGTESKKTSEDLHSIARSTESTAPEAQLRRENQQPPQLVKDTPTFDRNLKEKAIMKYLRQEENIMEQSLVLAKMQLEKEKEWERIRLEKEVSANSEITAQLLEREEQMIEAFRKLELEKKHQEMEIASLREQLSKLEAGQEKAEEQIAKPGNKEQVTIQTRISDKELQKISLEQEVERLRQLRKQKESDKSKPIVRKGDLVENTTIHNTPKQRKEEKLPKENQLPSIKPLVKDQERGKHEPDNIPEKKSISSPTKLVDQQQNQLKSSLGSRMNRSYSTPDLAQALLEEEDQALNRPSFERALKPVPAPAPRMIPRPELSKKRDLDPVYGSSSVSGLTGLKNLGNTCYMNSIIQCISNCALLTNFLINGSLYRTFLNRNNATRGEITNEFSSVLKAIWSGQYRSISCEDFKNAIGKHKSSFAGYQQQDSHEFLTILIDLLHEELNEARVKIPLKEQNNKNILLEEAAHMAWQDYTNSNKSIIVKLFGGQQKSTVHCLSCREESVTFEPFFNLSLPIPPGKNYCNIMDCFSLYTKPEEISGWSCPFCKQTKGARKKIDIWKLPPVLVVHLQRFYNDGMWRKRITDVEFSVESLDLRGIIKSNSPLYSRFNLFAVSNHYGTMDAGHYTASCKNPEDNKWYVFDDQKVAKLTEIERLSAAPYILFYTAINYEPPRVA